MTKTYSFEFWKLTIIDKENDTLIRVDDVLRKLEKKPLDISKEDHRYHCKGSFCYRAISNFDSFPNGPLISFSKYENKDIKGSMLENGIIEFDAIEELNKAKGRNDIAIKEYNRVKIYSNGIVIFQVNQKANTMHQLKEYLEYHFEDNYEFEIVKIYIDDLFKILDRGVVEQMTFVVGFAPDGSFDAFDSEANTGAETIEVKLKKPKDGFLKKGFLKNVLSSRQLKGFGILDNGSLYDAKARVKEIGSNKAITVSLEQYHLKDKKTFTDTTFYEMEPNKTFDELYDKHRKFLDEYAQRDARYKK